MAIADHKWESAIRGNHVYKAIWTPEIGEILKCKQERGNSKDLYAFSVIKDDTIVGHISCEKSFVVQYFLEHNGAVTCEVTDRRKHEKDLEVPCLYNLTGKLKSYGNYYLQLSSHQTRIVTEPFI